MSLTPRQERIKSRLYDKLQSFRFNKISDREKAAADMEDIIQNIDQIVDGELDLRSKEVKNGK
jgi:hypothetical protein